MLERRHRTPWKADGPVIAAESGVIIAICFSPALAKFICTAANFFDRLTKAVRVCRGEYDQLINPNTRPGYKALIELIDEYEKALRGHD